jgi:hypothetical protein
MVSPSPAEPIQGMTSDPSPEGLPQIPDVQTIRIYCALGLASKYFGQVRMANRNGGGGIARPTLKQHTVLLILALLLAFARLALDLLAQLSGKPPEVQNTMDIILIVTVVLALIRHEQNVAESGVAYTRSTLLVILLFGIVLGLAIPAIGKFLLRA